MKTKQILPVIFILSFFLLSGCASLKPTPSRGFETKVTQVFNGGMVSRGGYSSYPSISPDMKKKIYPGIGGDLFIANIDGSEEVMLFDRKNAKDFDRMADLSSIMSKENAETEKFYKDLGQSSGTLGMGASAIGEGIEFGKDQMEILDISWSPDSSKALVTIFALWTNKGITYLIDLKTSKKSVVKSFYPPANNPNKVGDISDKVVRSAGAAWKNNYTIIYSQFINENFYVLEIDLNRKTEKLISTNYAIRVYPSPDGSKIAFLKPGGKRTWPSFGSSDSAIENYFSTLNLYISDPDFNNRKRVSKGIRSNRRVSWSRDGKYLSYIVDSPSVTSFTHTLYYYDLEKEKSNEVLKGDYINTPIFSSDNEIHFFLMNNHIFKVQVP